METNFAISKELGRQEFLDDLFQYNSEKLSELHRVISESKQLKLSVHASTNNGVRRHYIIMVQGFQDSLLIKLGSKPFAFPRGFPILWIPQERVQLFGFLPKFQNDSRQEAFNPRDIEGYTDQLSFFRKWSGFLGQAVAYELDGQLYWTATTKNSADANSSFVEEAHNLMRPFLTPDVCSKLVEQRLHLCAEMMSQKDQTHGARVLRSSMVVTAVCKGVKAVMGGTVVDNEDPHRFVVPLSHEQVVATCQVLGLPVDSSVVIKGADNVQGFLEHLARTRDFMTDAGLDDAIAMLGSNVHVVPGTVSHREVLGTVLEGIVMHLQGPAGVRVLKFKFPNYTCRTMCLRSMIEKRGADGPEADDARAAAVLPSSAEAHKAIEGWADAWCVSSRGREHWKKVLWAAYKLIAEQKVVDDGSGAAIHIRALDQASAEIGMPDSRALAADAPRSPSPPPPPQSPPRTSGFDGTVVVVLGPIGYGKSTMGRLIAQHLNAAAPSSTGNGTAAASDSTAAAAAAAMQSFGSAMLVDEVVAGTSAGAAPVQEGAAAAGASAVVVGASDMEGLEGLPASGSGASTSSASAPTAAGPQRVLRDGGAVAEHIDGDELDLDMDTTLKLGAERGDYTMWQIHKALLRGHTPVISAGGGVLFAMNSSRLLLRATISKTFAARTKLVVVAPTDLNTYADTEAVRQTILWRITNGSWQVPPGQTAAVFSAMIADKSSQNRKFCEWLMSEAETVVRYDRVMDTAAVPLATLEAVQQAISPLDPARFVSGSFKQQRLLVRTQEGMKHITVRFEDAGFPWDIQSHDASSRQLIRRYSGRRATPDRAKVCVIVVTDMPEVEVAHVTVNAGPHWPKQMRELAEAMLRGEGAVSLTTKDGSLLNYTMRPLDLYNQVQFDGVSLFCIA